MHTIVCIWHKVVKTFICILCADHLARVQEYLKIVDTPFVLNPLNPRMVRRLDYYTSTVFEAISPKLGAQNAVTAGGRYDHLMRDIGRPDIPGIGSAMGIEWIVLLVQEGEERSQIPHLFIAALGEKAQLKAFDVAHQLHLHGINAEIDYEGRSLKAQMRRANKLGTRYVLIIGEEELEKGRAVLRDIEKKVQEEISLNEAVEVVMGRD
jgi:histidyl-tRNA synthetase